jgi:hypothetical protein
MNTVDDKCKVVLQHHVMIAAYVGVEVKIHTLQIPVLSD